jgi:hypothetical protein
MERKCYDLDTRSNPPSVCRNSVTLWPSSGLCLCPDQGNPGPSVQLVHSTNWPQTTPKQAKKVKTSLDSTYSYLGGNAFGRDKKGKVTKDDSALSSEMAAAGVGAHGGEGSEYTAYVYYDFEII